MVYVVFVEGPAIAAYDDKRDANAHKESMQDGGYSATVKRMTEKEAGRLFL